MQQLSLLGSQGPVLADLVSRLAADWTARLRVPDHAHDAARIVSAHFHCWEGRTLTGGECRRVTAYFGGVIRRRLLRSADPNAVEARRLLVTAAVEADLREAGWRPERASVEARRVAGLDPVLGGAA